MLTRAFQSHNGAIAARKKQVAHQSKSMFQSHNGAIAARITNLKSSALRRFNPTMVRLLPNLFRKRHAGGFLFQSHNGAIAAAAFAPNIAVTSLFQSHNGAIAAG